MLRNRANALKPICRIDVTAFASVMVVLVFAMLLPQMEGYSFLSPMFIPIIDAGVGTDLPKVWRSIGMPDANRDDALIVAVMRDGQVFFGNDRVAVGELPGKIRERLVHSGERKVYIRADARVRYGYMSAVLDGIRSAGILRIGILVDQSNVSSPVLASN
jgi:biopolymer transport protein TolR